MMPAYCPDGVPPGEKQLYAALQQESGAEGWIVLHSLGIAEHVRQVQGEADFVVIVPDLGILVIEVKSHRTIERRSDGTWKLGNDRPTSRGPFQQANEAMHSVREYLKRRGVDLASVPILSAVWFTGVRARTMLPPNPEWHDWQVLDLVDLQSAAGAIGRTLSDGTKHLGAKNRNFAGGGLGPDSEASRRIAQLLRPKFELASVAGDRRRARETQLIMFIEEQYRALDAVAENRAVLFSGPAGAGKTFLAMESARREVAVGGRGRLLCFNRFLGRRLARDMADIDGLSVGTFHQELLALAGMTRVPEDASPDFWVEVLPNLALEALIEGGDSLAGDFLVVDEIQDIATDAHLDLLELMVEGGLRDGRLLFFGDFERQAIYGNREGRELLRNRAPNMMSHRLLQNCRNLPRIGHQVNLFSHLQPGYRDFRRLDDGVDPVFRPFRAGQDQSAVLVAELRSLKDQGFELNEIVVLSPSRGWSTAETTTDPWLRQVLTPADGLPPRPGQLQYSTIQAFKGLDAPAVVLTDLDPELTSDTFEALLYVGLTRATDRLVALVESGALRRALGGTS
jgi:hypothetical protein